MSIALEMPAVYAPAPQSGSPMPEEAAGPSIGPAAVAAARAAITDRGVAPGPDGHSVRQLVDALRLQGWGCALTPGGAVAFKRHVPPRSERPTLTVAAPSRLEALTVLLARAYDHDDRRR